MRDIRHRAVWPVMILCVGLVATYLCVAVREFRASGTRVTAAAAAAATDVDAVDVDAVVDDDDHDKRGRGVKGCVSGKRNHCCLRFCTLVLAFLVWMTAAGALTFSGTHHERRRRRLYWGLGGWLSHTT